MRKKIILVVVCGVFLSIGVWKGYLLFHGQGKNVVISKQREIPTITLTLDGSDRIATYSSIPASTVFAALQYVSREQHISIQTKQYDFGVFVEQIGDKPNTNERAWIYSVNGTSGTVASDKYDLHSGDTILWQYVKPIF